MCVYRRGIGCVSSVVDSLFGVSSYEEAVLVRTVIECGDVEIHKSVQKSRSIK